MLNRLKSAVPAFLISLCIHGGVLLAFSNETLDVQIAGGPQTADIALGNSLADLIEGNTEDTVETDEQEPIEPDIDPTLSAETEPPQDIEPDTDPTPIVETAKAEALTTSPPAIAEAQETPPDALPPEITETLTANIVDDVKPAETNEETITLAPKPLEELPPEIDETLVAKLIQDVRPPEANKEISTLTPTPPAALIKPEPEAVKPVVKPKKKKPKPVKKVTKKKKAVQKAAKPRKKKKGQDKASARRGSEKGVAGRSGGSSGKSKRSRAAGNAAVSNYPGKVAARLRRSLRYPSSARGKRGEVRVRFTVSANGSASGIRVVRSSGSAVLDKAALRAVRRAAPFPRIPKGSGRRQWTFTVPLLFKGR